MKIIRVMVLCCVALLGSVAVYAKDAPIQYKIRIDLADLTSFAVEMKIQRQRPGLLRVAMAVHPEYDNRYFRYIENFSASDRRGGQLTVAREEDTVWRIDNAPQQTHIRYRLRLPAQQWALRQSWKPFLTRDGGSFCARHYKGRIFGWQRNYRVRKIVSAECYTWAMRIISTAEAAKRLNVTPDRSAEDD